MAFTIVTPNIPIEVLIPSGIVLFVVAFIVVPFFFGGLLAARKVNLESKENVEALLANAKSLSKIEVDGNVVSITRAPNVKRVKLQITAKGKERFKMNKKLFVNFANEETIKIEFDNEIDSLYLVEIDKYKTNKPIFLSDFVSAVIIAACQLVAVTLTFYLTVYAYEAFNVPNSHLYHENYNYAYLVVAAGFVIGVVSFIQNIKRMKQAQNPFSFKKISKRKGGK